jgi:hypothetical protein
MPKRKRRVWHWASDSQRIKLKTSASGSFGNVPVEPPPLAEAIKIDLDAAREWHGDRAVARFLWDQYKAACKADGRPYVRDDAFKRVAQQMKMHQDTVENLLNRSAKESAKREQKGRI